MRVNLLEVKTGNVVYGRISVAEFKDMPLRKDGWNFSWRKLHKTEGSLFYKIALLESPEIIEGVMMATVYYDEMVFLNNIEIAPYNIGKKKKYDLVAVCLIAFGCKLGFMLGSGDYQGYVSFESKSELIKHYQDRYGATLAAGQKMFIDPINGKKLIEEYLNEG